MITQQMEEYLEAIGKLEERGEAVTTSAIARVCNVSQPTVTEMLRHLVSHGLVEHEPRKGIDLTAEGRKLSRTVIRRHRLWERFLHDVLGMKWDKVHEPACQLEHVTSEDLERRLEGAVGDVTTCPHGYRIPESAEDHEAPVVTALSALAPGAFARVVSVTEDSELLRALAAAELRPGSIVSVEEHAPDTDTIRVSIDGQVQTLSRQQGDQVLVTEDLVPSEAAGPAYTEEIPLGDLPVGETAPLKRFSAGRGLVGRCLALGFTPGVPVHMVRNSKDGPIIVTVRDTRIALGRGEAQKILVGKRRDEDAAAD